jgi:hypothetical protein
MDDLRQRLARFDRPGTPRPEVAPPDREPLRRLLDAGARWHGVAPSGYLKVERDLGNPVPRTCIDSIADDLGPDVIVLDTETTGLESGTGTLVFVVGLVRWSASGLRLTQLFLPEPAGERAFLQAVADELSPVGGLLSYNGRGFDVPRLRSRMRLHRIDESGLDLPHLDLLHLTRRVVRGWLPDARLKTVEDHFLGRPRHGDLPGEFAPDNWRPATPGWSRSSLTTLWTWRTCPGSRLGSPGSSEWAISTASPPSVRSGSRAFVWIGEIRRSRNAL